MIKSQNNLKEGGSHESPSSHSKQNTLLGIGLFLLAVTGIALISVFAKLASVDHHPIDILFYRNIGALIITVIFIKMRYGSFEILKTDRKIDHLKRAVVGTISVGTAFAALAVLPVTDVTVLLFTTTIFTAILSVPMLGEKVGLLRWGIIIIGFIGVYIAVNPEGMMNWYGIILAAISSITSAIIALYIRDLGRTEPAIRTVFYFLLIGAIILTPFMFFVATAPTLPMFGILALIGVLGFSNQILKTNAYAIAPAALLAPFLYTGLIWAIIFDIMIWHTYPDKHVIIGGLIIIASNLFLVWRERALKS